MYKIRMNIIGISGHYFFIIVFLSIYLFCVEIYVINK